MQMYGLLIFLGILFVYLLNKFYYSCHKICFDIDAVVIAIYISAFLGGKILYLLSDLTYNFTSTLFSSELIYGGFSLLGSSFFGLISLLYYVQKKRLSLLINAFLPISLIALHGFGRIGCFFAHCCGGIFYNINLYIIVIAFYFFLFFFGLFLFYKNYIKNFYDGLYYYVFVIFFERFIFDSYRFDSVNGLFIFSKYQEYSLLYFLTSILFIFFFKKKYNLQKK